MKKPKSKKQASLPIPEEKTGGFKINLINKRKNAYPDLLTETDYLQIKPGDYLTKGTTIYEVIRIYRAPMNEVMYNRWYNQLKRFSSNDGTNSLKNLIDEYKENGNFGVCWITAKSVIRGGKAITTKGRNLNICEIDQSQYINRWGYKIVDLQDLSTKYTNYIQNYSYKVAKAQRKLNTLNSRLDSVKERKNAITTLLISKIPEANIQAIANINEDVNIEQVIQLN